MPIEASDRARQEARLPLIVAQLGSQGCDGLVPGERDVAFGLSRLIAQARDAKVRLLSANLALGPAVEGGVGAASAPAADGGAFLGHLALRAGELRVCAVAVNGQAEYGPDLVRRDPVVAVQGELAALEGQGCDVRLLLAHMERQELEGLLEQVSGFDAAILAHQGTQPAPRLVKSTWIFGAGSRGREVQKITFSVADAPDGGRPGAPLVDLAEGDRVRQELKRLDTQAGDLEKRLAASTPAQRPQAERLRDTFRQRAQEARAKLKLVERPMAARGFQFESINLGTEIADLEPVRLVVEDFDRQHPEPAPLAPAAKLVPALVLRPDGGAPPPPPLPPRPGG